MILTAIIFLPAFSAVVVLALRDPVWIRRVALAATAADFFLSVPLFFRFDPGLAAFQFVERRDWIPLFNIHYALGVDGISLLLVLMTALLMPLCVLISWRSIERRLKEFLVSLLLIETAMLGVFCALDFVLFYVFWEGMLIPMYLIIGVWGGPNRLYAAIKFFLYTLVGSLLLLVAMIALFFAAGHTFDIPTLIEKTYPPGFQFWIFLAFFLAFAVKVPMFPFHTWLPDAHVEAPTAGSVILASVLLKMGAYGFLRFCLPMLPDGTAAFTPLVLFLSVTAILYGAYMALSQADLKTLIAYSSVSHMGFVTLGIFMFNAQGIEGALLQMVNHGITTGALFLCVGIAYERTHSRMIADYGGLARNMPAFAALFVIFSLSSLGLPGTNSFVGEFLILVGAFLRNRPAAVLATFGVVLAAVYLLWMVQRTMFGPARERSFPLPDLSAREFAVLVPLAALVFFIGLFPGPFLDVMHTSVNHLLREVQPGAVSIAGLPGGPP